MKTKTGIIAVNACKEINPENPQAVAKSIGAMYKALKLMDERLRYEQKHGWRYPIGLELPSVWIERVIAQAATT